MNSPVWAWGIILPNFKGIIQTLVFRLFRLAPSFILYLIMCVWCKTNVLCLTMYACWKYIQNQISYYNNYMKNTKEFYISATEMCIAKLPLLKNQYIWLTSIDCNWAIFASICTSSLYWRPITWPESNFISDDDINFCWRDKLFRSGNRPLNDWYILPNQVCTPLVGHWYYISIGICITSKIWRGTW